MKVLLIGGSGYIGSGLYRFLVMQGHTVKTVDAGWHGYERRPDIAADYSSLSPNYIREFEAVVLLAAHSSVPMCRVATPSHRNNVLNFIDLLEKLGDEQKFIYASSSSVYGNTGGRVATEEDEFVQAVNPYDLQKQTIDQYARMSGKNYYGLRFGTVNGWAPHLRTDIMINKMVFDAAKRGKREEKLIAVSNPEIHRPILCIQDLTAAVEAILSNPGGGRNFYNLASFNSTVFEIAQGVAGAIDNSNFFASGEKWGVKINTPTPTYDFSMSCEKFKSAFNFEFQGTIDSIARNVLIMGFGPIAGQPTLCTTRSEPYPYYV
jgi:UDP-glucuronate 4-epimerase